MADDSTDTQRKHDVDDLDLVRLFTLLLAEWQDSRRDQRETLRLLGALRKQEDRDFMALSGQGQALADQINTNTNKLAAAQTATNKTIQDLVDKLATGTIDAAEFTAAVQPFLDTQGQIADALLKTATDNDPAVTPGAPPIEVVVPPAPSV